MDYCEKESIRSNKNKLLPIILVVASAAERLLPYYPSVLWSILFLFLFLSTANLQFAVDNKKAQTVQRRKPVECRGSPLANAKEFYMKSEGKILSQNQRETYNCCNLTRNAFHRKSPMHVPVFDK
jgi:hypothetical protein